MRLTLGVIVAMIMAPLPAMANQTAAAMPPMSASQTASIGATFELLDGELWVILPPALHARTVTEKWDVLAFLYRTDELPPHKMAYTLQDRGSYYVLTAPYPRQKPWALQLMLSPPKGRALQETFAFFDRAVVAPQKGPVP